MGCVEDDTLVLLILHECSLTILMFIIVPVWRSLTLFLHYYIIITPHPAYVDLVAYGFGTDTLGEQLKQWLKSNSIRVKTYSLPTTCDHRLSNW